MKKVLLAASAVVVIAGSANAADLKAPVYKAMAPVAAYNWTGFYLGVNAGIGVGQNPTSLTLPAGPTAERFNLSPIGGIGGVQAGYNWQFGNWVLGVEADIQGSGQKDSDNCVLQCVLPANQTAVFDQSLSWFGTVRARAGYTVGPVFGYYTGGFAYGGVKTTIAEALTPLTTSVSFSETATGWTLGSGVEVALGGNWTAKAEYLYIDLGSGGTAYTFGGLNHFANTEFRNHIFRGGLNYRMGATPVMAALPAANWTGFYVGGNLGSGMARNESGLAIPGVSSERFLLTPRGFLGGVQAGYNWQAANWVFGVEADIQGSAMKDDENCLLVCTAGVPGAVNYDQKMSWLGTVRGRVGFATGPSLIYLTGGLAYGKVETQITETLVGTPGSFTFDNSRSGWTIGGGIERPFDLLGLFGPNWTSKTEYLYVDLGSSTHVYTHFALPHTFTTDATAHIFRTGLNYHFNPVPLVAKY